MEKNVRGSILFVKVLSIKILLIGVSLIPTVFQTFFATSVLSEEEQITLCKISFALIFTGLLMYFLRRKFESTFSLVLFGFCLTFALELGFRLIANQLFSTKMKSSLEELRIKTYPECNDFVGHPFLQFTRRPCSSFNLKHCKEELFNKNEEFSITNYSHDKPDSVYRIASLGGSTTEFGYPRNLERLLNQEVGLEKDVEVMNFGVSSWTSMHTMINFLINVIDYHPDMIIVHHGWNEWIIRDVPEDEFKSDYSHIATYYREPSRPDKHLLRLSLFYRAVKYWYLQTTNGRYEFDLMDAVLKEGWRSKTNQMVDYSNLKELEPYRKYITTIVDHALLADIQVVLTTMPMTTDSTKRYYHQWENIYQCNNITRQIALSYGNRVMFIDLNQLLKEPSDSVFMDLAHLSEVGKDSVAKHVSQAILDKLRE